MSGLQPVERRTMPVSEIEAHRREWVAAVDGYVAGGRHLPEACRLANAAMECEHAPLSYHEWAGSMHRDDATDATKTKATTKDTKDTNKETDMAAKKHRTGYDEGHKRAFVERVIELVDGQGRGVERARCEVNNAMGFDHTVNTMRAWMAELGLRYQTSRGELVSRARAAATRKGKGKGKAGGMDTDDNGRERTGTDGGTTDVAEVDGTPVCLPVVDCEGNAIPVAGLTFRVHGPLPSEEQVERRAAVLVTAAGKLARMVASLVEGEIRTAMPTGLVAHAAEARIAELMAEAEADAGLRRLAEMQAGYLVAAYLRGRMDRPESAAPADGGAVCDALQAACTQAAEGLRGRADGLLAAVGLIVAELRGEAVR